MGQFERAQAWIRFRDASGGEAQAWLEAPWVEATKADIGAE